MVEQWPAVRSFFASTEEQLVVVERILQWLDQPILKLYFLFLKEILPLFNRFNLLFQSERPLIHVLHSELTILYKKFLLKFICEETVDAHSHSILELDFEDTTTHHTDDQLYIGQAATDLIASCDELDRHQLKTFYNNCRCFYIAAIQEIRK